MIGWTEQKPEVGPRPLSLRTSSLPAEPVSATPMLVWSHQCRAAVYSHLSKHRYEQGGLLLGFVWHQDEQPSEVACIDITTSVVAPVAYGTSISLAMGPQLWDSARANAVNGQHVVGWYHSHPGLGAFFSSVDRSTQAAFFRESWQLGLVVDPVRDEQAWFLGAESVDIDPGNVWVVEDDAKSGQVLD